MGSEAETKATMWESSRLENLICCAGKRLAFTPTNILFKLHIVKPIPPCFESFEVKKTHSDSFEQKPAHFVERPETLRRINSEIATVTSFRSILYLHGIAGCGKTLLARHFARSRTFTALFELPGKSEVDFHSSLARYAEDIPGLIPPSAPVDLSRDISATGESRELRAREKSNVDAILHWLNATGNTEWFILIDDIQFHEADGWMDDNVGHLGLRRHNQNKHWVQRYIEKVHQGIIVITSQSSKFTQIYPSVKVEGLRDDESLCLMKNVLGLREDFEEKSSSRHPPISDLSSCTDELL
jgi:hypothetical protein